MTPAIGAALLTGAVLVLVLWRPARMPVWAPALGGAGAALALGLLHLADVGEMLSRTWDATLALLGLMVLSATLEANGAFRAGAWRIAKASNGRGWPLFFGLCVLTAAATLFVANDGAILILTPIVADLGELLELDPGARLALLFSTGFLCDALSLALPTTNLTNLLAVDVAGVAGGLFARKMGLPTLAVFVVGTATLALLFRRKVPRRIELARLGAPPPFSRRSAWATLVASLVLALGYKVAASARFPLGVVVAAVAAALAIVESRRLGGVVSLRRIGRELPLGVVVFANAMFLVVTALWNQAGPLPAAWMPSVDARGVFATGAAVSLLCDVGNNLPVYLVALLALAPVRAASGGALELAALVGANVGSKLTPIGSLATLLWLDLVARRGLRVSWPRYVWWAALPTVAATAAALALLALAR